MVEKNLEGGDSSQVSSLSSPTSVGNSVLTKITEGTNENDSNFLEKTVRVTSKTPVHQELPASLTLIDSKSNLQEILVEQKAPIGGSVTGSSEVDNSRLPSIKEDSRSFPSATNEVNESKEAISDNKSNLQEFLLKQKAPTGGSTTGSSEVDNSGLPSIEEESRSFPSAYHEVDESKETINDNKSSLQEISVKQKALVGAFMTGSPEVDNSGLPLIKEDSHSFPSASDEVDESKEAINDNKSNLQEILVEQKAPIGGSITGSSEVGNSGLPSMKEDSHSFPSASIEVGESKESINDNESNLQEILVEQKAPIGGSLTGSSEVDSSGLPSIKEDFHSFPSASSEFREPKESSNDNKRNLQEIFVVQTAPIGAYITGSSEVDDSGLPSIKEDSRSFSSASNEVDESKEAINDNKSILQEILVEQKAPIGAFITGSLEVDYSGLPSVKEDSHSFPSASNEVDESKEAINDFMAMQSSGENTHATSQTSVSSREDVQCAPLRKVQNGASCSDSEKTTCEAAPAILTKVKEDKPRVMPRWSERQMSLRDTRQKVPAPVRRLNRAETFVDTTNPIESVKMAASKFGGSMNWKKRRALPVQENDHVKLEVGMLKNEISKCKEQAEAAEAAKLSVFNEIERTNKLSEVLKRDLERAQHEEADAKEDLDFFQFIVPEMEEGGVSSDDSLAGKEILKNIQERHKVLVSKLNLVNDELKRVQEDYDSLLIEHDISTKISRAAITVSIETERQAEELTVELNKLKEVLDLARATCHDAEEQKVCMSLSLDEERLKWEKDISQAEEELSQLNKKLSSVEDLKSELETYSNLLVKCNEELTVYVEAKLIEEAQAKGTRNHETMQEETILSRNELEEHMKSIDKARDEVCTLKIAAASLQSELRKEKEALVAMQQLEATASTTISSLEAEIKLAQQELEAVQAKEKESRDRTGEFPRILQAAAQEADEAKSVAMKAHEMLRMNKEEMDQVRAGLSTMEFRLQSALKEMEAAKESERVSLEALRELEESELAANIAEQGSPRTITLDFHEHATLVEKAHQAEERAHEKTSCATAQVKMAKESESLVLSRLGEAYKVLEERKQSLLAATKRADTAAKGKLAMEQELRTWREEHAQRRKAGEASRSETKPSNTAVVIFERDGDTRGTCKEDSCALVHPVSDPSASNSPALHGKTSRTKKPPFLRRMMMFLARRRLKAAE
ncbi:protein WEAK CHLOROPLAST MOVEMENT UNDER BLUE LIGHT 1-like [Lolium rigidum]|uniref:protein WEAK CHLOROPLAST MOVEMENT UNDER BLUE LIGHT 1-like n=1 Tax=Lolium rigidum TaxID=89674 RepID=UPI001F5C7799|nr:protein WEAK CHLOROPLAST MOVEMENT UNDER BLUE LIGHT 1-like [Lolium rigidum]